MTAHTGTPAGRTATVRYELTNRSVLLAVAAVASIWLLAKIWGALLILVGALILVGTLNPYVAALQGRGFGRTGAAATVFLGVLAVLGMTLVLVVPPLLTQLSDLSTEGPTVQSRLAEQLASRPSTQVFAEPVRRFKPGDLVARHGDEVIEYSTATVVGIAGLATTLALAFYILVDPTRYLHLVFAAVPRAHHVKTATILARLESIVGGYMRGQVITSVVTSAFVLGLLLVCGVPAPVPLAVLAGLADVLPFVGGLLSAIPASLAAMVQGPQVALGVLIVMLVYQEFESRILVPRVYGKALRLPPGAIVVALLIGGSLMGLVGALIALPVAAAIVMLTEELRVVMPGLTANFAKEKALDEQAAKTYEARSVGAVAGEASVIAAAVASEIADVARDPT